MTTRVAATCPKCAGRGYLWTQLALDGTPERTPCDACPGLVESRCHYRSGAFVWQVAGARGASPNARRGAHWSRATADRDFWRMVLAAARPAPLAPFAAAEVVVCEWGRPRDLDNVIASIKWPLDALVHGGILADDGPRVVRRLSAEVSAGRPAWCPKGDGLELTVIPMRTEVVDA